MASTNQMSPRNRYKHHFDILLGDDVSPKRVKAESVIPQSKTTKQSIIPKKSDPVPDLTAASSPIQYIRIVNPDALNLFSSVTI